MKILVDMDGVLANFELGFLDNFKSEFPEIKEFIPLEDRKIFHIKKQYPEELKDKVDEIIFAKGFFKSLPPISGSIDGIKKLRSLGHEVFICTSPLRNYKNCVLEKYEWVDQYLGGDFVSKIILSRDKTMVNGDILIDDRPEILGSHIPTWEHVLFRQPYNINVNNKRHISWNDLNQLFE